jgi:hypothetical protein
MSIAAVILLLGAAGAEAHARRHFRHHPRVAVGFNFGFPLYGPYYGYHPWGAYAVAPYGWVPVPPPNIGFVDLDVRPEEAEVYVGGELVGIADDFDGYPNLLPLRPGRRVVTLRHPGYRDMKLRLGVEPGIEINVNRRMVPRSAPEQ